MRRYGRFQGLVLSLGSESFYRDVARNWRGIGLIYLLLLFTLTWIPVLAKWQIEVRHFADNEFRDAIKDLPPITVEDGQASSPVPQPYTIKDPKTGKPIFILDTTDEITSLDQTPALILVTETKLHMRNNRKIEIHDLDELPDFTISKEDLQEGMDTVATWLGVGLFPVVMIVSLIRALLIILVASLIGLAFNSSFNSRLSFGALLRLAAVGMTLSVYLGTVQWLTGFHVPFWFWFSLALTTGYVAFGTWKVGSEPPADVLDVRSEAPLDVLDANYDRPTGYRPAPRYPEV